MRMTHNDLLCYEFLQYLVNVGKPKTCCNLTVKLFLVV